MKSQRNKEIQIILDSPDAINKYYINTLTMIYSIRVHEKRRKYEKNLQSFTIKIKKIYITSLLLIFL